MLDGMAPNDVAHRIRQARRAYMRLAAPRDLIQGIISTTT
jgi:hypothetical protein